ncbi:MAG TPA: GTPase HflX [Anaerolineales bacterium]|nr:GTPase HflX [Anaerolineales bacterium]
MTRRPLPTESPRERAFLVAPDVAGSQALLPPADSLDELGQLATTAGLDVVGSAVQRLQKPDPKTFLGSGKVIEVRDLVEENLADVVIFDEELSPRHLRELERAFGEDVRVLDRTALILDIFAQHAHSREGRLQVELAQYEYRLPRLTRAWTHLARQAGGGGGAAGSVGGVGLRGPGETQLEVDRRDIGRRITHLRRELEKVRQHRSRYRRRRRLAAVPTIALVGYTNAGKSTLLGRISGAEVVVADQLFATLDPMTRKIQLPSGREALLTDTVGFIQKLPPMVVAAFRATLEEVAEADLLLHVVDISHPQALAQASVVRATLEEVGAENVPVITALNKVDRLADPAEAVAWIDEFERGVPISALTGDGIPALLAAAEHELYEGMVPIDVRLPYDAGRLLSLMHDHGWVERTDHQGSYIHLVGRVPQHFASEFEPYKKRLRRPARGKGTPTSDNGDR